MGVGRKQKSFPTNFDFVCVSELGRSSRNNPGSDTSLPEGPHHRATHTQSLSQNQLFPSSISLLASNTPASSPMGWSHLWRVHTAGELPKNP